MSDVIPLQGCDIPLAPKTGQVAREGEICVQVRRTEQTEDNRSGRKCSSQWAHLKTSKIEGYQALTTGTWGRRGKMRREWQNTGSPRDGSLRSIPPVNKAVWSLHHCVLACVRVLLTPSRNTSDSLADGVERTRLMWYSLLLCSSFHQTIDEVNGEGNQGLEIQNPFQQTHTWAPH